MYDNYVTLNLIWYFAERLNIYKYICIFCTKIQTVNTIVLKYPHLKVYNS